MKYIDAEKLLSEIESRMEDCKLPNGTFPTTTNIVRYEELSCLHNFITSLQQEQPDNEDIDKVAQELYEHLYELKRCNNVPTNLYDKQEIINLWKAGIVYGRSHPKQEQLEMELDAEIHEKAVQLHTAPTYEELEKFARHFYDLGLKARKEPVTDCEDLEEAAKEYDEAESWRWEAPKYPRREAFEAGAEWQYQKDRGKFAQIKAKTWCEGFDACKEQMMKDAVEGEVCILPGRAAYVEEKDNESLKQYLLDHFKYGDKVKIIIVKEEEK